MKEQPQLSDNPYEHTLALIARKNLKTLKQDLARQNKPLRVSDQKVLAYIRDVDPELLTMLPIPFSNQLISRFWSTRESENLLKILLELNEYACDEDLERNTRAEMTGQATAIRACYLGRELQAEEPMTGTSEFLYDFLCLIIPQATSCGYELPPAWTDQLSRKRIADLLTQGYQDKIAFDLTLNKTREIALENGDELTRHFYEHVIDPNRESERSASFWREAFEAFISRFPDPKDFVFELLDVQRMQALRKEQQS
ncbi:hypothetical protein JXD20_02715 [Candidatus Peregrinibacteria bacterium]|nr:hypothetical protein [Candidatus Peregrinibacteria bacterium]